MEAALIMYHVAAWADPDWFFFDYDGDILEWFFYTTVLEEDGPNAMQESEPLTNRLALVRLARFYHEVFYF